jgi:prepilin-type N-terminal cleavage/methylation domain-containing protein
MKKIRFQRREGPREREAGMTLIELLIAMLVLAVGLAGIMAMVVTALASNGRNRTDTTATLLSQMVIEQLANVPAGTNRVISVTDCTGVAWNINTAGAAAPAGAGAALTGTDNAPFWVASDVNFSVAPAYGAAPGNGYGMRYITCGINVDQRIAYDVRWNITSDASGYVKTVTVATRNTGAATNSNLNQFAIPVQLKTILGN